MTAKEAKELNEACAKKLGWTARNEIGKQMTVKRYIPPILCDDDNCTSGGGWHMVRLHDLSEEIQKAYKKIDELEKTIKELKNPRHIPP